MSKLIRILGLMLLVQSCDVMKVPCQRLENGVLLKEIVIAYRHPEKQYLPVVKTTNANLKATIDVLDKIKIGELDAGSKRQVTELRQKLDQYSSRTQDLIKAAFLAKNSDPCNRVLNQAYFDLLENINKENTALEKLRAEISGKINSTNTGSINQSFVQSVISNYYVNGNENVFQPNSIEPTNSNLLTEKIQELDTEVKTLRAKNSQLNDKVKASDQRRESLSETNQAYLAAIRVNNLLNKIQLTIIENNDIYSDLIGNVQIVEAYYRKTEDCNIGYILKDFLSYYIAINENNKKEEIQKNVTQFRDLRESILKKCENK